MTANGSRYIYGPVPSRRLGRSLGIDLVPLKVCTYDCVYCQLGRTTEKTVERREYISIKNVARELKQVLEAGEAPDYISLAGSGEPTLNSGIGEMITRIKDLTDIPMAVITNGSLLWREEVREELKEADLVLPSLDAGDEEIFKLVNRPHREITFQRMIEGLTDFTKGFAGEVWLEILMLNGVTGIPSEARKIGILAERIGPMRIQLNTVARPPAEEFACALSREQMRDLRHYFPGVADIVSDNVPEGSDMPVSPGRGNRSIVELLGRRPCTPEEIAVGLGIHIAEAIKYLDTLTTGGVVRATVADGRVFYTLSGRETS